MLANESYVSLLVVSCFEHMDHEATVNSAYNTIMLLKNLNIMDHVERKVLKYENHKLRERKVEKKSPHPPI